MDFTKHGVEVIPNEGPRLQPCFELVNELSVQQGPQRSPSFVGRLFAEPLSPFGVSVEPSRQGCPNDRKRVGLLAVDRLKVDGDGLLPVLFAKIQHFSCTWWTNPRSWRLSCLLRELRFSRLFLCFCPLGLVPDVQLLFELVAAQIWDRQLCELSKVPAFADLDQVLLAELADELLGQDL